MRGPEGGKLNSMSVSISSVTVNFRFVIHKMAPIPKERPFFNVKIAIDEHPGRAIKDVRR